VLGLASLVECTAHACLIGTTGKGSSLSRVKRLEGSGLLGFQLYLSVSNLQFAY